jgi:hypothetical protein
MLRNRLAQLQSAEGRLARPQILVRFAAAGQGQHRVVSPDIVVHQVLAALGQAENNLPKKDLNRKGCSPWFTPILEAGGQMANPPSALFDSAQDHQTAIRRGHSPVALDHDLAASAALKSQLEGAFMPPE